LNGLLQDQIELERQKLAQLPKLMTHDEGNGELLIHSTNNGVGEETVSLRRSLLQHTTSYGSTSSERNVEDHQKLLETLTKSFRQSKNGGSHEVTLKWHEQFDAETVWQSIRNVFDRCFQPPVVGSILGIIAAMTPIRGYFVDTIDRRSHAPLQWMFDGFYSVGQTAVPINMMILGCNLSSDKKRDTKPNGLFSTSTSIGIVLGKMVILPIIGILSAMVLKKYIWDVPDEIDGSFYIVMIIVFLCPTANNVMVMVELSGSDAKEGIARVIALQYAVAPLILSLTMTVAIGVADSWS
jgi:predicted permease